MQIKITEKLKITTYHFEEEAGDRRNGRNKDCFTNRKKNDDEIGAITIRKYYEK